MGKSDRKRHPGTVCWLCVCVCLEPRGHCLAEQLPIAPLVSARCHTGPMERSIAINLITHLQAWVQLSAHRAQPPPPPPPWPPREHVYRRHECLGSVGRTVPSRVCPHSVLPFITTMATANVLWQLAIVRYVCSRFCTSLNLPWRCTRAGKLWSCFNVSLIELFISHRCNYLAGPAIVSICSPAPIL